MARCNLPLNSHRMMQTRFPLIWSALVAALLWGCANPVSWENDVHLPVLDDRVTWADVVSDTLYEPGVDGGPAHFVLVDTLDGWDWGEWVTLPDTTISVRYDGEGVLENGVPVQKGCLWPCPKKTCPSWKSP